MATVNLTRQTHIASFMWVIDHTAAFSYGDEDAPRFFYMADMDWLDMGKPATITISITPGDALNG